ncbi:MAG: transglycosylase SLT domain-containing protein [Elusimicrobiota bacterium]|jgi:membrane-bound lytic murein transglycosylase D|nr:transglycosylase SLT domain-containing protein [Elusimicrobiota bacterium]
MYKYKVSLLVFCFLFFVSCAANNANTSAMAGQIAAAAEPFEIDDDDAINPKSELDNEQKQKTDKMAVFVSEALAKAPSNSKAKRNLILAQDSYKKMLESLRSGSVQTTKKHFNDYIEYLQKADIDAGLLFFIFDDLGNVSAELNRLYGISDSADESQKFPSIPLTLDDNTAVEKYIQTYSNGKPKERIQAALERSGMYRPMIEKTLRDFGLPKELIYLPVIESLYSIGDVSRAGATGLWQIMAHRGRALGLHIDYWIDERRDPEKSTIAAAIYLKELFLMLNDWHLALAAYNRGEYGLVRDMRFSNAPNFSSAAQRKAIPKETQNYVPQFIAMVIIGNDLKKYDFTDIKYQEPIKYDKVKIGKVIDLKIAAQCAGITLEEIKKLNPALKAWSTPQGYPDFELKIPAGTKETFLQNLANIKPEELNPAPDFIRYKIEKGDYLGKIAKQFNTTETALMNDNPQLKNSKYIQPNQVIMIRPGKGYF